MFPSNFNVLNQIFTANTSKMLIGTSFKQCKSEVTNSHVKGSVCLTCRLCVCAVKFQLTHEADNMLLLSDLIIQHSDGKID